MGRKDFKKENPPAILRIFSLLLSFAGKAGLGYLDIPLLKNVQPEDIEDVTNRYVHLSTEERNSDVVKKVHIRSLDLDNASNNADNCDSKDTGNLPFCLISLLEHKSDIDYNVIIRSHDRIKAD